MTLGKNQANAPSGTAVVRARASKGKIRRISSGRSRQQQRLIATCKDSSHEAKAEVEERWRDWRMSL
jgi:hypothetical protein